MLFAMVSRTFQVTITRCYVIPTNRHYDLGLDPFRRAGCKKVVHEMHNKVQITLDSSNVIDFLISVVLNHLDYSKIKILSPGVDQVHVESHRIDHMVCVATYLVRMNEVDLNHALTVHEKRP